ncbi:helix-turn-helix domain-containing protein [Kribbella sp. CA-245084]|uniref:helix-turn-helix domain-containing protein n=1 Tax=Kribbella sp. CA-245084 TaxID=3239940 RepID=UPI003D8F088B
MFESLGLSQRTLGLYRTLLQDPMLVRRSRVGDLSAKLDLTEEEVRAELDRLREFGLLVPRWNIPDEEYPLHPTLGLERLAARRQEQIDVLANELQADKLSAGQFVADYTELLVQRAARDVEVLEGRERAYARMQHFQPTKSTWGMLPYSSEITDRDPSDSPDRPFLERGIDVRYLVTESQMKHRASKDGYLYFFEKYGAKVRTTPSIPMKLIIFDGESAVMGIDPDDVSVGAVVHHSRAVVNLAQELFLKYWIAAEDAFAPSAPREGNGITAQDIELLKLLVQGATDEQVARRLGVSMRTVRRIVSKLSDQVRASGRFELGVRAAQRGWVD